MVRFEAADLPEKKKEILREIADEWSVDVRIIDGWDFDGLLAFIEGGVFGFFESYPYATPLTNRIYVQRDFLEVIPPRSLEFVLLHETGHVVDHRMGSEEFAEKFALKHFSGSYEEYTETWAYTIFHHKTGESLADIDVGDDFV